MKHFISFSILLLVAAAVSSFISPAALGQTAYPRVNLAPWYEVDPDWPQRPSHCEWADMPGIAVDNQDQIWLFTRAKPPVQVYAADGTFVRAWGDDVVGRAHHIKIDHEGNVWLSDIGLHTVRKFTPEGKLLMTLGTPGVAGVDDSHFNMPTDMVVAPNGDIFVSDGYGNARVVHIDKNGKFIKAWGSLGTGALNFNLPHGIAMDSKGRLYVADRNNVRVQIYSQDGKLLDSWSDVIVPWGFSVTENDEIWVCGSSPMQWRNDPDYPGAPLGCPPKDQVFMKFNTAGRLLQLWSVPKGTDSHEKPGDLNWVHCLAMDSKGNIYAGDIIGKRAQKFLLKE